MCVCEKEVIIKNHSKHTFFLEKQTGMYVYDGCTNAGGKCELLQKTQNIHIISKYDQQPPLRSQYTAQPHV